MHLINKAKVEGHVASDHICGGSYDVDHVRNVSVPGIDSSLTPTLTLSKMYITKAKPLHTAAALGFIDIVSLLIEHGASVDSVDELLWTPLHFAASQGQKEIIEALIHSGANVNAVDHCLKTPCMKAASRGFLESIQALIEGGADLAAQDRKCRTALYSAAKNGYTDLTLFFITNTKGYALNAEAASGESILSIIARWKNPSYLSFLLNLAPSPDIYEPRKSNILVSVVKTNKPTLLKLLLRRLPQQLIPTLLAHRALDWGTPLYVAATQPAEKTIDMLLAAGADLELEEGGAHGTPLLGACAAGRLGVVKALVRGGARTSYTTKDGHVFSALAAAKYHQNVMRWLLVGRFLEGPLRIENGGNT